MIWYNDKQMLEIKNSNKKPIKFWKITLFIHKYLIHEN